MQREVELLRLLDAVLDGVFGTAGGESAAGQDTRREELLCHVNQTVECASALTLTNTEAAAGALGVLLQSDVADAQWQALVEEHAEQLHALAERELEARMVAATPPHVSPGMPWSEFVLETREHLANIEQELLRLENMPGDTESVHALFRSFHTIKGLAAIAGAETAREVAHHTENLLDEVRNGTRPVNAGLIDLALASADFLSEVAAAAEQLDCGENVAIPDDAGALLDQLYTAIQTLPAAEETEAARARSTSLGMAPAKSGAATSVKVDTAKLDQLVDLVGELVIAQSLVHLDPGLTLPGEHRTLQNLNHLGRITSELQKTAMSLRVVPVGQIFRRMTRMFRDLIRDSDKRAILETAGEEAELDRTIVEQMAGPLMHMVRNAVDHGLESPVERERAGKAAQGRVRLSASHQAGHVVIEVSDDGRGLDQERIVRKAKERGLVPEQTSLTPGEIFELIFHPGFSTSDEVTAISGRGVGMDVVRREIEKLRGRIDVRSVPGRGTTFLLRVPLTLAIIDALVVRHGHHRFILPIYAVREILKPGSQAISTVEGRSEVALLRDRVVPVIRMESLLGETVVSLWNGEPRKSEESLVVVVVEAGATRVALPVDEVLGKQEVVIKSLGDWLGRIRGVAGGAILGDGSVGIILDVDGLIGKDGHGLAA